METCRDPIGCTEENLGFRFHICKMGWKTPRIVQGRKNPNTAAQRMQSPAVWFLEAAQKSSSSDWSPLATKGTRTSGSYGLRALVLISKELRKSP